MSELIPIQDNGGVQAVMGRDLHAFLEVGAEYRHWFPRMLAYGFEERKDYTVKIDRVQDSLGREREAMNHVISLDMAKEISMIQRTDKGKQARQYFIECEKKAKAQQPAIPQTYAEALEAAAAQARRAEAAENEAKTHAKALEAAKPKVLFADAVNTAQTTILVGDLAKILKGNGINIGANRLFSWLRQNGYLISRKGTDWNMPTQRAMELGLFRVKENAVTHSDGHITINKTPKVTGKGQEYFTTRFLTGQFTA